MSRILKMLCITDEVTYESELDYPLTITANSNRYLNDYKVYGSSVQEGTPSPDAPIEVMSVGDLVTDGEYAGKYRIPVTVTNGNRVRTADIYLDEPLRQLGGHADYIDFRNKKVVRKCILKHLIDYKLWQTTAGTDTHYIFSTNDNSILPQVGNDNKEDNYGFSNMFRFRDSYNPNSQADTIFMHAWVNNIRVTISKSYLEDDTIESFEKWLAENNPYMIRVRATAKEEPVELPPLLQLKGENTYTVETAITPSGIQVKYY